MKASELRKKSVEELRNLQKSLRDKLRELRFGIAAGKVKNVRELRQTKRDIARILTIIKEKESLSKQK